MKFFISMVLTIAGTLGAAAQERPAPVTAADAAAWREDLRWLVDTIAAGHANPWSQTSEAEWRAAADSLGKRVSTMSRPEIIFSLASLVTRIGDGHTRLWAYPRDDDSTLGFRVLPVRLERFADGYFVVAVQDGFRSLLGAQVRAIAGKPLDAVIAAISPALQRDNQFGVAENIRHLLVVPELLYAGGIVTRTDVIPVDVILSGGVPRTVALHGIMPETATPWVTLHQLQAAQPPTSRRNEARPFNRWLDDAGVMVIEINAVANLSAEETLPRFCATSLEAIAAGGVDHVVVDLRRNAGGSRELAMPCVTGLQANPRINRPGHLFVLVGPRTFSAGLWTALDLARTTHSIVIGEPTGGKPNHFGETRRAVLPNHRLPISWGSRYNVRSTPSDTSRALMPTISAPSRFADFMAGRDAAIDSVRAVIRRMN